MSLGNVDRSIFLGPLRFLGCAAFVLGLSFSVSQTCHAQLFGSRLFSSFSQPQVKTYRPPVAKTQYRSVTPVTGYGSNFHRNFTIRQQQIRVQSGQPFQKRNNVLWRKTK
jgi:hypothetical protein